MYAELIEKENSMDINTLRQLQAEATHGPWTARPYQGFAAIEDSNHEFITYASDDGFALSAEDARLIAAAPTHLADLITALEQIERVRELHKAFEYTWGPRGKYCKECSWNDHSVPYPCPTIRILDGNE